MTVAEESLALLLEDQLDDARLWAWSLFVMGVVALFLLLLVVPPFDSSAWPIGLVLSLFSIGASLGRFREASHLKVMLRNIHHLQGK